MPTSPEKTAPRTGADVLRGIRAMIDDGTAAALGAEAFALYVILAVRYRNSGGLAWPAIERLGPEGKPLDPPEGLAADMGKSPRQVSAYLARLNREGLVESVRRGGGRGDGRRATVRMVHLRPAARDTNKNSRDGSRQLAENSRDSASKLMRNPVRTPAAHRALTAQNSPEQPTTTSPARADGDGDGGGGEITPGERKKTQTALRRLGVAKAAKIAHLTSVAAIADWLAGPGRDCPNEHLAGRLVRAIEAGDLPPAVRPTWAGLCEAIKRRLVAAVAGVPVAEIRTAADMDGARLVDAGGATILAHAGYEGATP